MSRRALRGSSPFTGVRFFAFLPRYFFDLAYILLGFQRKAVMSKTKLWTLIHIYFCTDIQAVHYRRQGSHEIQEIQLGEFTIACFSICRQSTQWQHQKPSRSLHAKYCGVINRWSFEKRVSRIHSAPFHFMHVWLSQFQDASVKSSGISYSAAHQHCSSSSSSIRTFGDDSRDFSRSCQAKALPADQPRTVCERDESEVWWFRRQVYCKEEHHWRLWIH